MLCLAAVLWSCADEVSPPGVTNHSFSRPEDIVIKHIDLDLNVDFRGQMISGSATLFVDNKANVGELLLDTWGLHIREVTLGEDHVGTEFALGDSVPIIGRPLVIKVQPHTRRVDIRYRTTLASRGVQWLAPSQTAGGEHPFLYTQSQAILARSWVPCQDTPAVRFTYRAQVRVPPGLMALMSARNAKKPTEDGVYNFDMPQPIPSYLLALAVGDLQYRTISKRAGVYAEPSMARRSVREFGDMENMIDVAESLWGPYRWEQYDVLVLPPSFPYGGMENPRVSFVTPILIAGDRSLVSTIAHELAHSWSGNLVSNATWNDFWLNEGVTTYFTRRIMEVLYGRDVSEMHASLGRQGLEEEFEEIGYDSKFAALYVDVTGDDPDEIPTSAAYNKGYLFLRLLEETVGRDTFDAFLRGYFDNFAFQTMTTKRFVSYLESELLNNDRTLIDRIGVDAWVYSTGIPDNAPQPQSTRFGRVDATAAVWNAGGEAKELDTADWTTQEWERFLSELPDSLPGARMAELERTYRLSRANGVIQRSWFLHVIASRYEPLYPALEEYLVRVGRTWLIRPLYAELAKTPGGFALAQRVYQRARPGYHAVTATTIDNILRWQESE